MAHTNKNKNNLNWISGLAKEMAGERGEADEVPDGWFTVREIASQIDRGREAASRLAREGVEAGRLEMKKFKIKSGQRTLPIPHYKEKK